MNNPISPEELQMLAAGYVLDSLSPEEAKAFDALRSTPETRESIELLVAQTQQALEVAYLPQALTPPIALRQRLLNSFAEAQATGASTTEAAQATGVVQETEVVQATATLPRWAKAVAALASIVILALAASNYALWRSLQAQYRLAELREQEPAPTERPSASLVSLTLEPTETLTQLTAVPAAVQVSVSINPAELKGTLSIENLPPLEPGEVYVLWTVLDPSAPVTTDAKGAILTEVFTVESNLPQSQPFALPPAFQQMPNAVKAIAITVEDATAPQGHEAAPILIQTL